MIQFQDMPLAEPVKKALDKLQFKEPTKIQNAVIEQALAGKDLMACAETGSGKTGAFGIPLVERLLEKPGRRSLILAPTRELAKQIADFMNDLTRFCDDITVTTLVGGTDMQKQFRALKKKPRIVVATPGRLNDHLRRRSIKLDTTEILVLDEGDRMLDMGFQPQLDDILDHLPQERQTHLFTATLPTKVKKLAEAYLQDPAKIDVGRVSLPVEKIKQSIVQVNNKEKNDKLLDELNKREGSIIVFFRTKARTDDVADYLEDYGFKVGVIHGDRSQGQRNRAIQQFKSERTRILCATDVAARGIDIPSVGHVINYDLPRMEEDYVHRIGRTARNGADGEALSFVARQDHNAWMKLAKRYKIQGVELENVSTGGGGGGRSRNRGRDGERRDGGGPKRYGRNGSSDGRRRSGDRDERRSRDGEGRSSDRRRTGGSDGPSGRWAKSKSRDEGSRGADSRGNYPKRSKSNDSRGERSERRSDSRSSFRSEGRSERRSDSRGERSERRSDSRSNFRSEGRSERRSDSRGERSERRSDSRSEGRPNREKSFSRSERSDSRSDRGSSEGFKKRSPFKAAGNGGGSFKKSGGAKRNAGGAGRPKRSGSSDRARTR